MQRRRGNARPVGSGGFGPVGAGDGALTFYAHGIELTEVALTVAVSTSTVPFGIAAIGPTVDMLL